MSRIRHAPDWVIAILSAEAARRYIFSDLPLDGFAKKFSEVASRHYDDCSTEKITLCAEEILRFVSEIEDVDFDFVSVGFTRHTAMFDHDGSERRIKTMFRSAYTPAKSETPADVVVKMFRVFLFRIRTNPELAAPAGWTLNQVADIDWLAACVTQEVTLFDVI